MVASRKKLKEQIAAGNAARQDGAGKDRKLKVQKKSKKKKNKSDKAAEEAAAEAEKLAELAAVEERKAAKKLKKEEKKKRKEAENAEEKSQEEKSPVEGKDEKTMKKKKRKNKEDDADASAVLDNANAAVDEQDDGGKNKPKKKNKKVDRWGAPLADPSQENNEENAIENTEQQSSGADEYHPKKIYAGGMPYDVSEDDIHSYFAECGAIDDITYATFPDTGKFRGLAFITFKTEAAAKKALELDGADMFGRYLRIQRCKMMPHELQPKLEPPSKTEGCTSVYVGNLPWNTTEDDLRKFFKKCKIASIRLAIDKQTNEHRGFGHVDFEDDESVERAVKLDRTGIRGRLIKVAYAVPKRASSGGDRAPHPQQKRAGNECFACGQYGHKSMHCPNKA